MELSFPSGKALLCLEETIAFRGGNDSFAPRKAVLRQLQENQKCSKCRFWHIPSKAFFQTCRPEIIRLKVSCIRNFAYLCTHNIMSWNNTSSSYF